MTCDVTSAVGDLALDLDRKARAYGSGDDYLNEDDLYEDDLDEDNMEEDDYKSEDDQDDIREASDLRGMT